MNQCQRCGSMYLDSSCQQCGTVNGISHYSPSSASSYAFPPPAVVPGSSYDFNSTSQQAPVAVPIVPTAPTTPQPSAPVATLVDPYVVGESPSVGANYNKYEVPPAFAPNSLPTATPIYESNSTTNHQLNVHNNSIYDPTPPPLPPPQQPSASVSGGIRIQDGNNKWGTYVGARNSRGQRHGYGTMNYDDGSMYEGDWKYNLKDGNGTFLYSTGPRYEGIWINNKMQGSGIYYYPDGRIDLRKYNKDECVGEGVQYCSSRQNAHLLKCGRKKKWISLTHASKIASKLGLSIPR
jgi:hypothetical protein